MNKTSVHIKKDSCSQCSHVFLLDHIRVVGTFYPNFTMLRARPVSPDLRMPVMLHIEKEREKITCMCGEGGDIKMTSVWLTCL